MSDRVQFVSVNPQANIEDETFSELVTYQLLWNLVKYNLQFQICIFCLMLAAVLCTSSASTNSYTEVDSHWDKVLPELSHHRQTRSAAVRKRRKNRKSLKDLTDEELYRYVQERAMFRYVFYQPTEWYHRTNKRLVTRLTHFARFHSPIIHTWHSVIQLLWKFQKELFWSLMNYSCRCCSFSLSFAYVSPIFRLKWLFTNRFKMS